MQTLSKNKIKLIRSLQRKKYRDEFGLFIVEGKKSVLECAKEQSELIEFICCPEQGTTIHPEHYFLESSELNKLTSFKSGANWLAVMKKPEITAKNDDFVVVLDGIQDPGNLGTIIRTCDWFGIDRVVCSIDTADCFNEKVVQATMGSIFRVSVEYKDLIAFLKEFKGPVYGALMKGENLFNSELQNKGALILGNEGNGVRPEIIDHITHPVHIPGKGGAESLNVAVAGAILMAEIFGRTV